MAENVAASGSCALCRAALDLAFVKADGLWYCGPACAHGERRERRIPTVPESWLYPVLHRFYGKRRPTELK